MSDEPDNAIYTTAGASTGVVIAWGEWDKEVTIRLPLKVFLDALEACRYGHLMHEDAQFDSPYNGEWDRAAEMLEKALQEQTKP